MKNNCTTISPIIHTIQIKDSETKISNKNILNSMFELYSLGENLKDNPGFQLS